jgi:predicted ATPase/DNA-binding SARP family transcriptional activator
MEPNGASPVRVEVLGPLRLIVHGEPVDVPGPKRRAVLALLALAAGRTVPVDDLVDALWPGELPESGRQALHTHISRLRTHLGPATTRLQTTPGGYRLELAPAELDLTQARDLLTAARTGPAEDPVGTLAALRQAHALWRGPVLADLTDVGPIATAVRGCANLYREVTDAVIACAVDAGQAAQVSALAVAEHAADPLRGPAVLQLMRVLAATGEASEALRIGREYRHRLAEETGLDPSPALDELERDIAGGAAGPGRPRPAAVARPTTRLIGREAEVAALQRLLAAERLVTVVGPGGVGKTRVATELAQRRGPAIVLSLAPLTDPAAIPHALAAALRLTVTHGDVLAACVAVLGDRPGLLLVDNCEHLLDAVRDTVGRVLASCPATAVLATSREPLGLPDEFTFRLSPLPLPTADQALPQVPSVAVFLDRASRVRPGPPTGPGDLRLVADIVRRLDGMPLAIELAAGRLSTFSLADLHARLDRALDLLGGGRPSTDARHRTLRAAVEWSYALLTEPERRLFRHLSAFPDGVDLDTAERLARALDPDAEPGGALARLVDASMVNVEFAGGTRYRMLETLRAFGADRLAAAGESDAAARHVLDWAVELTTRIGHELNSEREPEADAALRRELSNLRAAWRLARTRGALDDAATMITALCDAIGYRDLVELRGWAEELAAEPALAAHPRAAEVWATAAEAVYHRGDYPQAERLVRAGLERATDDAARWRCLTVLSVAELARGAHAEVVEHSLAAAEHTTDARENLGIAALALAYVGEPDQARSLNDRGLAAAESPSMRSWGAYVAGEIESGAGSPDRAERHYRSAIDLGRAAGATFLVGVATVGLLTARTAAGHVDDALRGYRDVIDYFAGTGNWTHLWATLRNLADLLRRLDDPEPAALIDEAADAAPDAPAVVGRDGAAPRPTATPSPSTRAHVLDVARAAVQRHLSR